MAGKKCRHVRIYENFLGLVENGLVFLLRNTLVRRYTARAEMIYEIRQSVERKRQEIINST